MGEMLISLSALLLLLLDMCRSSCETSFPRFVFIQTCPNHLLALAALPKSFCVPSVALPCAGEKLAACLRELEVLSLFQRCQAGCEGTGTGSLFTKKKKKKKICWMCPSMTHVCFPASGHDFPSIYHEDACSWPARESL